MKGLPVFSLSFPQKLHLRRCSVEVSEEQEKKITSFSFSSLFLFLSGDIIISFQPAQRRWCAMMFSAVKSSLEIKVL